MTRNSKVVEDLVNAAVEHHHVLSTLETLVVKCKLVLGVYPSTT